MFQECPAPPVIAGFSPASGCVNTTPVVITGTRFADATAVSFGGTAALSFTINTANQITAIPASGTTGTIAVTGPNGMGVSAATFTVNALPVPTITPTTASCANSSGNVYTTQSGKTNYVWTVTGGTATAGGGTADNTITITWGAAGTGHVLVNYTDANGCTATVQTDQPIIISASPTPTITPTSAVCANSTGNVYTTQSGKINYVWTVTGGSMTAGGGANDNTVVITWGATGTGHVNVNYTDVNGCPAAAQTDQPITIHASPTPTITPTASVTANSTGNVYTTESGKTNYVWTVTGGMITAGGGTTNNTATVTWGAAGTGHVNVNYSDANGCAALVQTDQSITIAQAEAPMAIPYQAVTRDNSGSLIANQVVSLRFTLRDATAGGTIVYRETQSTTTNALGLFTANIGEGTPVTGTFAAVDWGNGFKFMQVEMDVAGGSSYTDMGTQQMLSVPYALHAGNGNWKTTGIDITNSNSDNVGIGTSSPSASAKLEVSSVTEGFLPPRMTFTERNAIVNPAQGLMVYCTDCYYDGQLQVYNGSSWENGVGDSASVPLVEIGDTLQGGVVSYITTARGVFPQHGIIAAPVDQSTDCFFFVDTISNSAYLAPGTYNACTGNTFSWTVTCAPCISTPYYLVSMYANVRYPPTINSGFNNTNALVNCMGSGTFDYAAKICDDLVLGGYNDWVLPSQDELNLLYQNKTAIGGFSAGNYWNSSTPNGVAKASYQNFGSGAVCGLGDCSATIMYWVGPGSNDLGSGVLSNAPFIYVNCSQLCVNNRNYKQQSARVRAVRYF